MDRTLLKGWPVVVERRVVWGDMDSYGHVNNAVYFRYFENARLEYFRRLGWPVAKRPTGVGPILAETRARFKKPLHWPDTIAITARVSKVEADRFTLDHIIVSDHWGGVATEGTGLIVTFDYTANRKTTIPDELRRMIETLENSAPV